MPQPMADRYRAMRATLAATLLALAASPLLAQPAGPAHAPAADRHVARDESHEHANELAVFLGGTSEGDEAHLTLGAEYERRLGARLGMSFVAEHVDGIDAWVLLAPVTYQPLHGLGLKLYAGPGLENREAEAEHHSGAEPHSTPTDADPGRETFFVFRTGAGWALELGRASLTPQLELDFVREHDAWQTALVFGVSIGFGF